MGTVGLVIESLPGIDVGVLGWVVVPGVVVVGTLRLPGLDVEPSVPPVELVLVLGRVVSGVVVAGMVLPAGSLAPGVVASGVVTGFVVLLGAVVFLPFLAFDFAPVVARVVDTVET